MPVQKWPLVLLRCWGAAGGVGVGVGVGVVRRCKVGVGAGAGSGWGGGGLGCSVMRSTLAGGVMARGVTGAGAAGGAGGATGTAGTAAAGATGTVGTAGTADAAGAAGTGISPKTGVQPPNTPGAQLSQRGKLWALGLSSVAFVLGAYVSSKFMGDDRRDSTVASTIASSAGTTAAHTATATAANAAAAATNAAGAAATTPEQSASPSPLSSDIATAYDRPGFAETFDSETAFHERLWGILGMRQRLAERATGRVIEVGAGTGRNTGFYQLAQCESITLLDQSGAMLDVARKKWEGVREKKIKEAERCESSEERRRRLLLAEVESGKVSFLHKSIFDVGRGATDGAATSTSRSRGGGGGGVGDAGDASDAANGYDGDGKYDTVLQTMSVCSTDRPEALLQRLGTLVKPESGRILLLEHGRSKYGVLNRWLDGSAEPHAEKFGCWWNRDVGALVERSGLEVLEMRRHHLGTTWLVVLKRPVGWQPRVEDEP